MGNAGRREFIQVLRLMEDFHQHQVEQAVVEALRLGAISFDAVKMLLLARLENRPARLDLTFYPYLPAATVRTTDPPPYLWAHRQCGFGGDDGGSPGMTLLHEIPHSDIRRYPGAAGQSPQGPEASHFCARI